MLVVVSMASIELFFMDIGLLFLDMYLLLMKVRLLVVDVADSFNEGLLSVGGGGLRVAVVPLVLHQFIMCQLLDVFALLALELDLLTGHDVHLVLADHFSGHLDLRVLPVELSQDAGSRLGNHLQSFLV